VSCDKTLYSRPHFRGRKEWGDGWLVEGGFLGMWVAGRKWVQGVFQFQCSNKIRPPQCQKQQLAAKRRHFRCLSDQQQFNFYCYDVISIRTRPAPFAVPHPKDFWTSDPRTQTSVPRQPYPEWVSFGSRWRTPTTWTSYKLAVWWSPRTPLK